MGKVAENALLLFLQGASPEHLMSMVVMVNEKFRENVPAWEGFGPFPDHIPAFFQQLYGLRAARQLQMHERVSYLVFFIHAFQSLENDAVSKQVLRLVQLPMWHSLSPGRLQVTAPSRCGPDEACAGHSTSYSHWGL